MRTHHRLLLGPVVCLGVALTACSSSTDGSGGGGTGATSPAATTNSAPAPKTVTVTHPVGSTDTSAVPVTSSAPSSASSTPRSSSAPSTSTHPVPARPLQIATATATDGGTKYVIKVWAQDDVSDCAANAYGAPVIAFLRSHGCQGVRRLLATTTVNGRGVGFAQSQIAFKGATVNKSYEAAGGFRTLVTKDGTGNINDLFRDGYRLPSGPTSVPSPDAFSALAQDNTTTVDDVWYLDEPTPENDPALVKLAQDIYLQF